MNDTEKIKRLKEINRELEYMEQNISKIYYKERELKKEMEKILNSK